MPTDVSKSVIYRNVAFTYSNTQNDITENKKHAICLGMGLKRMETTYQYELFFT